MGQIGAVLEGGGSKRAEMGVLTIVKIGKVVLERPKRDPKNLPLTLIYLPLTGNGQNSDVIFRLGYKYYPH